MSVGTPQCDHGIITVRPSELDNYNLREREGGKGHRRMQVEEKARRLVEQGRCSLLIKGNYFCLFNEHWVAVNVAIITSSW